MTILDNNTESGNLLNVQQDEWGGVSIELPSRNRQGICAYCNLTFTAGERGRVRVFCSDECEQKHKHGVAKDGTKTCAHCSAPFEFVPAEGRPKKYCKEECRLAATALATAAKWKARARTPNGASCETCTRPLVGTARRFCSGRCHQLKDPSGAKQVRKIKDRPCEQCGVVFRPQSTRDPGKYCSKQCTYAARRKPKAVLCDRPLRPAECIECRAMFEPWVKSIKFCGAKCRTKHHVRKQSAKRAPHRLTARKCSVCEKEFLPIHGHYARDKCSDACRDFAHAQMVKAIRRTGKAKRRAIMRGAGAESVDPIKVFERDRWQCQLCGRATIKSDRGKHMPLSPELDHIIPLSRGGAHTYANTQCACRECNGYKSNSFQDGINFKIFNSNG